MTGSQLAPHPLRQAALLLPIGYYALLPPVAPAATYYGGYSYRGQRQDGSCHKAEVITTRVNSEVGDGESGQ